MDTELRFRVHALSVCKKAFICNVVHTTLPELVHTNLLRQAHALTNVRALYDGLVRSQLEFIAATY